MITVKKADKREMRAITTTISTRVKPTVLRSRAEAGTKEV
jgi:hypothetical protein